MTRRLGAALALLTLAASAALAVGWWIARGHPSGYDEITHLQDAWNVHEQVAREGLPGAVDAWMGRYPTEERPGYWPGAAYLATLPAWRLAPGRPEAPLLLVALALLAWLASLRALAAGGPPSGAGELACWLALLPGLTLVGFRHYTPTAWCAAAAMAAVALLVRGPGRRPLLSGSAFGLLVAWGLMADRLTFAACTWLPVLAYPLLPHRRARLAFLAAALPPVALLAGPFYLRWLRDWGPALLLPGNRTPAEDLHRLVELAGWLPATGWGPAAALAAAVGLLGLGLPAAAPRPRGTAPLLVAAAALSPLPLLARTEEAQGSWCLLLVGPVSVLAAWGWARLLPARPRSLGALAVLLTGGALLDHLGRSGWGPRHPALADRALPRAQRPDATLAAWMAAGCRGAVVDLLQYKDAWGALWLHYAWSVRGGPHTEWPLRRVSASWEPDPDGWLADPCAYDRVLVVHGETPWNRPDELERPGGTLGMGEADREALRRAAERVGRCLEVVEERAAPMIGSYTRLEAPPGCPEDMALVPGGRHRVGPPPGQPEAPYALAPEEVVLAPYCMDRHEYPNVPGALPRTDVTWKEAAALCAAAGKRLCTEREWEVACRWPGGRVTAVDDPGSRCHTGGARFFDARDLRPIGSAPGCVNALGIADLDGSVAEWTADPHPGPPFPPDGDPTARPCHVLRGGTMWMASYGQDCTSRHWHAEGHRQDDDGFRCCADPRPAACR